MVNRSFDENEPTERLHDSIEPLASVGTRLSMPEPKVRQEMKASGMTIASAATSKVKDKQ